MGDTIWHSILAPIVFGLILLTMWLAPPYVAAAIIAGHILFLRELTQEQTRRYDSNFFQGWAFWKWSDNKNWETWVPIGLILALGIILQIRA